MAESRLGRIWKSYLKELTIVIIGVTIAFWLEGIGESIKRKRLTNKVLVNIENEMQFNKERISGIIDFQNKILDRYDSLLAVDPENDLSNFGISIIQISANNSAYEIAKSNNILSEIDINLANEITRCYMVQDMLRSIENRMRDYFTVPGGKTSQLFWLRQLNGMEKELIGRYDRVLAMMVER